MLVLYPRTNLTRAHTQSVRYTRQTRCEVKASIVRDLLDEAINESSASLFAPARGSERKQRTASSRCYTSIVTSTMERYLVVKQPRSWSYHTNSSVVTANAELLVCHVLCLVRAKAGASSRRKACLCTKSKRKIWPVEPQKRRIWPSRAPKRTKWPLSGQTPQSKLAPYRCHLPPCRILRRVQGNLPFSHPPTMNFGIVKTL